MAENSLVHIPYNLATGSAFGGWNGISGPGASDWAIPQAGSGSAYGTKPVLPSPVSTAPAATLGAIQQGQGVNAQLPGYAGDLASIGSNISAETAGKLPPDVIAMLQQQGAERGVATGTGGSDANNAAYLKALGLTSLDLQQTGQKDLQSILPSLPGSAISQNPNFYPTSGQASDVAQSNAIYSAAPDPQSASQAAMTAAASGLAAGRMAGGGGASAGGGGQPAVQSTPSTGAPEVTGSGVSGTGVLDPSSPQSVYDEILAQYAGPSTANTLYNPNGFYAGDASGGPDANPFYSAASGQSFTPNYGIANE